MYYLGVETIQKTSLALLYVKDYTIANFPLDNRLPFGQHSMNFEFDPVSANCMSCHGHVGCDSTHGG